MTLAHIDRTTLDSFGNGVKAMPVHLAPEGA